MNLGSKLGLCTITFVSLAIFSGIAFAQIPNSGFENWAGGGPVGWITSNNPSDTTIFQTTDAHSGTYAAMGRVVGVSGSGLSPLLTAVFATTSRPSNVTCYVKFNRGGTDTLFIAAAFLKDTSFIAFGQQGITTNMASYTQVQVPMTYYSNATPDSAAITIQVHPYFGSTSGTVFYADDFAFSGTSGVQGNASPLPGTYTLEQNYPNPFNPTTIISYSIPTRSYVTLAVFNMLGQKVADLVNGDKDAGAYAVTFDGTGLASGVYLYRIQAGSFVQSRKLVILK